MRAAVSKSFPKTKKDVVVEFRREMILEAAAKAFGRAGYEATSVDAIAAEAGIGKGTVYLYFASKAEIYLSTTMHELNKIHAETVRRFAALSSCKEKIELFIRIRLEYVESHRDFCRIYISEFGSAVTQPDPIQKQLRKMRLRQADLLTNAISDGIAAGEIRQLPARSAAFLITDVTRGLLERRVLGGSKSHPAQDLRAILDLLWNGLKGGLA